MTKLSTYTRTELAHRSSDGLDVTLVWVQGDDEDKGPDACSVSRPATWATWRLICCVSPHWLRVRAHDEGDW